MGVVEAVKEWQERLDRDFPDGVVAELNPPGNLYRTARVEVTAMNGLSPEFTFACFDADKGFSFDVHEYVEVQDSPRIVKVVTFGDTWLFGTPPPQLVEIMRSTG